MPDRASVPARPRLRRGQRVYVVNTRTGKLEKTLPGFGFYAVGIAIDEKGRRICFKYAGQLFPSMPIHWK